MKRNIKKSVFYALLCVFLLQLVTSTAFANKNLDTPVLHPADFVWVNDFRAAWDEVEVATRLVISFLFLPHGQ